jgi:hypothetical protein
MWRGEESDFFMKLFKKYLRDHLTDASFSITSCHMKHFERILWRTDI